MNGEIELVNTNGNADMNGVPSVSNDRSLDVTQWHTYRFTHDGTEWKVYIDNEVSDPLVLPNAPFAGEGIPYTGYFAWFWGTSANADLDYMRYTDQGAFVPGVLPPVCGDEGYFAEDINEDCYVNMIDFWYVSNEWLECTDPNEPACDEFWL